MQNQKSDETVERLVRNQRNYFNSNITKSWQYRAMALDTLKDSIIRNEKKILDALKCDLNKSETEAYMTEIGMVLEEITYIRKRFHFWMREKVVPTPMAQFAAKSFVLAEPYGVTLIMAPWNYPFMLCIGPLIGAIAAGNCCILKPSAYSPATSKVIKALIEDCFQPEYIAVVEGGREENSQLLEQPFDYIFFTGGVTVGRLVMEKAAKNLTPVTLELGGKSPCIIDKTANLKLAAKRIVFGKFLNSGQACVAPDYVLIQDSVKEEFIKYVVKYIKKMYGKKPLENESYPKIVNQKHFSRIIHLLEEQKIVVGGDWDQQTLKIEPTVLSDVSPTATVMQEEIFGPILPILTFHTLREAEQFVKERPKPLACYIFTTNKKVEKRLLHSISFGGGCINDTIMHLASSEMGFGGVGNSGMGSYHGKLSFDTFSHKKSILKKYNFIDLPIRYQPYGKIQDKLIRMFLK